MFLDSITNSVINACKLGNLDFIKDNIHNVINRTHIMIDNNGTFSDENNEEDVEMHNETVMNIFMSIAAGYGQLETVKYLETVGGNIFCEDNRPFGNACKFNQVDVVKYFISKKVNITSQDFYGYCWSCKNGNMEIVKCLLDAYSDIICVKNPHCLCLAVKNNNLPLVNLLLSYKTDPDVSGLYLFPNSFPVLCSSKEGYIDILHCLIDNGANVTINNGEVLSNVCAKGDLTLVKIIISKGVNPLSNNSWCISKACLSGNLELVQYLYELGANIHNRDGMCMVYACASGNVELVKYIHQYMPLTVLEGKGLLKAIKNNNLDILSYAHNQHIDLKNIK